MPVYNKLVRDLIPAIIEADNKTCETRILAEEEYKKELKIKAQEELHEYLQTTTNEDAIEELADVLEVIHALAKCHGADMEQIEAVRKEKAEKRGGFQERIFLVEVHE